uniref:Uncharacterized protein n=1 Tax=Candidatus Giovannonibacteria bacterium GW2011_GWF2_42_19 TaxID=1618659 RepID=A0A0G0ZC21_9BACT|nr:MAG: hypothetical protein UV11_C0031G0002 [Candidatus Giovannonibacteria bacterium GW2011_GWF2_42_19]
MEARFNYRMNQSVIKGFHSLANTLKESFLLFKLEGGFSFLQIMKRDLNSGLGLSMPKARNSNPAF